MEKIFETFKAWLKRKFITEPPEPQLAIDPDYYDIALRPDHNHPTRLDDVVVRNVKMFRAEDMGDSWWLACYFESPTPYNMMERICWTMSKKSGRVVMETTEYPQGNFIYEEGSLGPQ